MCSWLPFSVLELQEALLTCSNASALGPSHLSWEYLKLLLKDDQFKTFFLQLANDLIQAGTWPDVFKTSITVIISKLIANWFQSDSVIYIPYCSPSAVWQPLSPLNS